MINVVYVSLLAGVYTVFSCSDWSYPTSSQCATDPDAKGIGWGEAMYFSIVTQTTIGYGDYSPKKWSNRAAVLMQVCAPTARALCAACTHEDSSDAPVFTCARVRARSRGSPTYSAARR